MFDNINFEHLKLSRTKHSFNEQANNNLSKEFKNNQYSFSNFYTDEKNYIDFVLDGDSYTIIPKNISDFAKDHLIFLQCFSIIDAYKNFYTDRINFPSYLLVYTYEGTGELFYQNQKYVLSVGQGFLINCENRHSYRTIDSHWKHFVLHFNGINSKYFYEQLTKDGSPIFNLSTNVKLQQDLEELLLSYQSLTPYSELETAIKLQELLLSIIKSKNNNFFKVPNYIFELEIFLQKNFSKRISLDELSTVVNISKFHLEREFKKYTGFSINQYIIELRIQHACFLLSSTNYSIEEISFKSGFSNYHAFLKLFKKRLGTTPGKYRTN